jgi:D-glycero-D-manno-heptose 1,7-bisphosphate phosphatase
LKTLFLDRDGVINYNRRDHVKSVEEFVFLPGALESLRLLHRAGWTCIVVTNQAVIQRGIVPRTTVDAINHYMRGQVERYGGRISAVFYCPHSPEAACGCRKPEPGLLLQAARLFKLRLDECYLVGDAWSDIAAARAVGCHGILVKTGRGVQALQSPEAALYSSCEVEEDLAAVANRLLHNQRITGQLAHPGHAGAFSDAVAG